MEVSERAANRQEAVELVGVLGEFRTALREEIDAARRVAANSGIQLLNGRLIGQAGDAYQYAFTLESVLNLPDDLPGELRIPGQRPVEATIVSLEGVSITISVPEPLGEFIARASLQSDLTMLLRILIERIEALSTRPNPAGDRLLGKTVPSGEPVPVAADELNASQAEAVASAVGRDTTFVWGPPGTGKTRTIGRIGEQLVRSERSVLVVSHTNSAVDQAIVEVVRDLGDDLVDGSVLRLGTPKDQRLAERERLLAETHIKERSQDLLDRQAKLLTERAEKTTRLDEVRRLLAIAVWHTQADAELARLRTDERALEAARAEVVAARMRADELKAAAKRYVEPAARARALAEQFRQAEPVRAELARREARLAPAEQRLHEAERLAREAEALHEEVLATGAIRRRLRGLPRPEEQGAEVGRRRGEETAARAARDAVLSRIAEVREPLDALDEEFEGFKHEHRAGPDDVLHGAEAAEAAYGAARERAQRLERDADAASDNLRGRLGARLGELRSWGLTSSRAHSIGDAIAATESARASADELLAGVDPKRLQAEVRALHRELAQIGRELEEIAEALKRVEQDVIAAATVVATTLTRAYKRESIQARRFDTVILDEASMAPIPALWAAAALADVNVVVVGDFKQLAPIKHSTHALAEKWLGQDVFDVSGIRAQWEAGTPPAHLAQLKVQYRMHPRISAIPNAHFYDGTLSDGKGVHDESALDGWYDRWEHDQPVLLVDTGPMNAWVTSVNTGGRASRLNFLSATVCVDLAERLLLPDRPELPLGERARILIASPYRPQTRLTNLLIRDQGLEREVVPGTAHTFQGNEAPVVIFDTVLDEPHFRAGLFVPDYNDGNGRLLNVALTRARRRLIVVGDFTWLRQKAHRRSILRRLVEQLCEQHLFVSALDVMPAGFAARAAEAHERIVGGEDAPDLKRVVVTQDDYYRLLVRDLQRAQQHVVFYSAFLTPHRVAFLEPHLRALVERGVPTYVVTKTIGERPVGQQETAARIERALTDWGLRVLHKLRMHEKLVFIDEEILWSGSLNSLSFTDTQEVMERRVSRAVADDYARILRLDALIAAHEGTRPACPICGSELIAAEARGGDPFYWRCSVEDCYTRGIDQPTPRHGRIICARCGGPVEYREMPSGHYWRCTVDPHHRQRVIASHLRLPRMRELFRPRELARLERALGARPHQLGLLDS
jgi:AAA domain